MLPPVIEFLKDKSVYILGFGREGRSTYNYIRKYLPEKELCIGDGKEQQIDGANVKCIFGDDFTSRMGEFDVVIKSPGIPFRDVEIPENTVITCQPDLFMKYAPCKKIGVTGSKGKTTTSTLIYKMLCAGGVSCRLMGNMGLPFLDFIDEMTPDTVAVAELSSHQLEFTRTSPDIAVLTNIFEEHLEHYKGGMTGYVNAKLNIVRYQNEENTFVYNGGQGVEPYIDLNTVKSKTVGVCKDGELPFEIKNIHLAGEHNRQDVLYAYTVASLFGVTAEEAEKAIDGFEGIEHRMEKVGTFKDITFYNDCIATIPHAVMCAVNALNAKTLIMGGKDRGIDYSGFARDLENSGLSLIIGTKSTGHKIIDMMTENGTNKNLCKAENLEEAVKIAYKKTETDGICILSPAASSYNEYKNFEEKGRHYKDLVKKYGE